jgi:hypothetical protein
MKFHELDKDVFQELHKLDHSMRFWRSVNNTFTSAPCAHQQYVYFFHWVKYLFMFYLAVRIRAITTDEHADGVTIGKWLNEGSKQQSVNNELWRKAKSAYTAIRNSTAYKSLKETRDALYAHNLASKVEVSDLPNQTFHDLFGLVEDLEEVYDLAAVSGMCASTHWGKPYPANIEDNIIDMMRTLEISKHRDRLHKQLIERDNAKKIANPELY